MTVLKNKSLRQGFKYVELAGIVLTICLLPVDRFPYLHHTPLKLGAVSFTFLVIAALGRLYKIIDEKRWDDLKKISFVAMLTLLPVIGYAQSIHYAIDKPLATGATRLLLVVALKALCFFILLRENRSLWRVIKLAIYGIAAVVVAFGFFQFIFDVLGASPKVTDLRGCCTSNSTYIFPRVHSVSLEPLYFANFLIVPLWLMIHDFTFDRASRRNKFLLVLFIASSSLFILSLARSALLGLIVSGVIFMAGLGTQRFTKRLLPHALKIITTVVVLALAFVILSGFASRHIHKHAINGANSGVRGNLAIFGGHAVDVADQSAQTRYATWPKAIDFIKEHPIKGVGAYNSRVRLNLQEYRQGVPDTKLQPFNNDLLGLLVDLGLIGILTFGPITLALLISLFRSLKLQWSTASTPFALTSLAMLIQANFFQSILLARLWVIAGITLTGLYVVDKKSYAHSNRR